MVHKSPIWTNLQYFFNLTSSSLSLKIINCILFAEHYVFHSMFSENPVLLCPQLRIILILLQIKKIIRILTINTLKYFKNSTCVVTVCDFATTYTIMLARCTLWNTMRNAAISLLAVSLDEDDLILVNPLRHCPRNQQTSKPSKNS